MLRSRRSRYAIGLGLSLLIAGCGSDSRQPRQEFVVGSHRASIAFDTEWQHVAQGRRHLLRRGEAQLVFEDLGPAGREGMRHEVERVRALWFRGQPKEARTALSMIPVPSEYFTTPVQRRAFWEAWHEVSSAPFELDTLSVGRRFDRLFESIDSLRARSTDETIDLALRSMGEDGRRSVARREAWMIDGRDAVVIETWSRVSHEYLRGYGFLIDGGYLLVVRTDRGPWPETSRVFREVLRTLQIGARDGAQRAREERNKSA